MAKTKQGQQMIDPNQKKVNVTIGMETNLRFEVLQVMAKEKFGFKPSKEEFILEILTDGLDAFFERWAEKIKNAPPYVKPKRVNRRKKKADGGESV